jgi:tRNA (adenine57-N1/adenine58-N1)-methyltransferase
MSNVAEAGQVALLIGGRGRRFMVLLKPGGALHTHEGIVSHDHIIGWPWGCRVRTQLGKPFLVLEPSTHDLIVHVRRQSQIIYPKEAGYILLKMSIRPGVRVIEAGSGSGGLTIALARAVAPHGRVYSYECRPDMQHNAIRNVTQLGLEDCVDFVLRDIGEGFDETDVDAVFLDVRTPWDYLVQARAALKSGGFMGALVPTTNQVSELITGLEAGGFCQIEVEEMLLRAYKPAADRLRPADTMIGHTGFMVFARWVPPELPDRSDDLVGARLEPGCAEVGASRPEVPLYPTAATPDAELR